MVLVLKRLEGLDAHTLWFVIRGCEVARLANPSTVREYEDSKMGPSVNKAVIHIDNGPHSECSAITLTCVVTSVGERWLSSSAWVLIHPLRGSRSFSKKSSLGRCEGGSTVLVDSALRWPSYRPNFLDVFVIRGGGGTPYRNAVTWVQRSTAVMKVCRTFFSRTYV